MYAFIDRPAKELSNDSQFLVFAVRAWTELIERGCCPAASLASSFATAGLLPMLPHFHLTMALLNRDAVRRVVLAPLSYPLVLDDEAILLAVWRDAATRPADQIATALALLFGEDSLQLAARGFVAGAKELAMVNLDGAPSPAIPPQA